MGAVSQTEANKIQGAFEPVTVVIRHGIFWYFSKEMVVVTDDKTKRLVEQEQLVQRIANQNDSVELVVESDYKRGLQHYAFWTDEDLATAKALRARESQRGVPAAAQEPATVQVPTAQQFAERAAGGGEEDRMEPLEVNMDVLEAESDYIEWLQGTGMFDGQRAPNADEVIKAAGDDPELAKRLLAAEPLARGDQGSRSTVEKGLNKIIETHS